MRDAAKSRENRTSLERKVGAGLRGTAGTRRGRGAAWAIAVIVAVVMALGLLGAPRDILAQPGQAERVDRLTGIFSEMPTGTGLRVITPMIFIEHGTFRELESETVQIRYGDSLVPVSLADIRSVQVERHHPVKGMLWGLGSGLLVGSVSGLLFGSFFCEDPVDCESAERRGAIIGGTSLGLAGGIAGFVIGRYQVSWSPVFP
ncbi:MAG: hypothetical protein R3304_10995 [Longimicrobiales bacterium]|nr:hypothetical protein [Longimicrobiales bacterium]